jgi:signal transduction histidine kinase/ActR/RegA family two-component response regulator
MLTGFILSAAMLGVVAWIAITSLESNQKTLSSATNVEALKVLKVSQLGQILTALQRAEKNIILAKNQGEMSEYEAELEFNDSQLNVLLRDTFTLLGEEGAGILAEFEHQYKLLRESQKKVIELTKVNANVKARELSQGAARDAYDGALIAMKVLVELNDSRAEEVNRQVLESGHVVRLSARAVQDLLTISRAERNMLLAKNSGEVEEYASFISIKRQKMQTRRDQLRELVDDDGKILLDQFASTWDRFLELHLKVRDLVRQNDEEQHRSALILASTEGRLLTDAAERLLARLTSKNDLEQAVLLARLERSNSSMRIAARINRNLTEIQRGEKNIILAPTQAEMDFYASSLIEIKSDLDRRLRELEENLDQDLLLSDFLSDKNKQNVQLEKDGLVSFRVAYSKYQWLHQRVRDFSRMNSNSLAIELSMGKVREHFDSAEVIRKSLATKVNTDMALVLEGSRQDFNAFRKAIYFFTLASLIVSIIAAFFIARALTARTRAVAVRAQALARGSTSSLKGERKVDELSVVDEAIDGIQTSYLDIIEVTNDIAAGNIHSRLVPRSADDPLVESINRMAENVTEIARLANVISEGDLTVIVEPLSDADQLRVSMRKMVANLLAADHDRQQQQEQLQEAKNRAEHANAVKGQFLAKMSHELRTPLNAIIGLSGVLVADMSEISPTKQTEYLSAINDSGQHLLQLIGDILDIEKLDASERTLENNPFTVLEVLDLCYKTFSFTCQSKGINLTIDNQLNEAYTVVGDITVLTQILFNLLSNAVKFTEVGSVSLVAAPQLASESDPNPGIIFTVTDTGKGIKADAIPKLFDLFTQEDSSITRSFGGSGLGLNIAQKLAQLMNGEINCTSSVGHGSTFEMVLYLEKESKIPEKLNVDRAEILHLPPLKLLVVDDVQLNLLVAIALLEPHGHAIETVDSGRLAVDMASNNDYDAILMDIHMPDISGVEATKMIRNFTNKQRAAVPIIALSADVDASQQTQFIDAGMNTALGKPWKVEDLEKELKHLLRLG